MSQTKPPAQGAPNVGAGPVAVLVVLCAIWGLQQVAIKVANTDISPVLQAGFRSLGAVALLMTWAAFRGQHLIGGRADWPSALAIGLLFTSNHVLLFIGLDLTSASRGVVLYYTAPFFVALGAQGALARGLGTVRFRAAARHQGERGQEQQQVGGSLRHLSTSSLSVGFR